MIRRTGGMFPFAPAHHGGAVGTSQYTTQPRSKQAAIITAERW
jgi:hypothetical protein